SAPAEHPMPESPVSPLPGRPLAHGNPVLYSAGDRVWLFHTVVPGTGWSTAQAVWQESADRGRTWSPPQRLPGPLGTNVRYPPVRTASGDLLLPAYDDLLSRALFFASRDGSAWRLSSTLATAPPHNSIQPSVAPLADGRLLAVLRNTGGGWLWYSTSADSGRSWAAPAAGDFPNPASAAALLRLASGRLVLIYNDSETERHPLALSSSDDEATTWRPPRVLVDGPGTYDYPAAVQAPDGLIHVLYSHERRWIGHITIDEAWLTAAQ
ncbi:MAG: sialidase family protein, partial [Planctomycetota bacterium]